MVVCCVRAEAEGRAAPQQRCSDCRCRAVAAIAALKSCVDFIHILSPLIVNFTPVVSFNVKSPSPKPIRSYHVAKKKALTAVDTAYMTACKTRCQFIKPRTAIVREVETGGCGTSVAPNPSLAALSAESGWLSCEKHNLLKRATVAL
jgi:hypothetical protein